MAKLTVFELSALTAKDHGQTLREDDNLYGRVNLRVRDITVKFYYRFKWAGKFLDLYCGAWPNTTLSKIRDVRDEAKHLLNTGVNPCPPDRHRPAAARNVRGGTQPHSVAR